MEKAETWKKCDVFEKRIIHKRRISPLCCLSKTVPSLSKSQPSFERTERINEYVVRILSEVICFGSKMHCSAPKCKKENELYGCGKGKNADEGYKSRGKLRGKALEKRRGQEKRHISLFLWECGQDKYVTLKIPPDDARKMPRPGKIKKLPKKERTKSKDVILEATKIWRREINVRNTLENARFGALSCAQYAWCWCPC